MHFAELADVRANDDAAARCISDDAVALNNGEFAQRVRSVAGLLAQSGVRRGDVVATLFGGGSEDSAFIVRTLRLPRGLTAVLVGAGFGISGAIFQRLARNPLASPDIIGIKDRKSTRLNSSHCALSRMPSSA